MCFIPSCRLPVHMLFVVIFCDSYTQITKAWLIDANIENQYRNKTIQCIANEECIVDCRGLSACRYATIHCPSAYPCNVRCSDSWACANTVIYAQTSSFFRLSDCAQGTWTCIGITIYFPPNKDDIPASHLIGADFGLSAGGAGLWPLQFYAINGWKDVNVTTVAYFDFHMNHIGVMYCKQDYSASCNFSNSSWACANADDLCNDPSNTIEPSAHPITADPTKQPTYLISVEPSVASDNPTKNTMHPTDISTVSPTIHPAITPTQIPTKNPTELPTITPTVAPTKIPTSFPTKNPTAITVAPTKKPTKVPTNNPTIAPTKFPTLSPTNHPTTDTVAPTKRPTHKPTAAPTPEPTRSPTLLPSRHPSVAAPSSQPTPAICDTTCVNEARSIQIKVVYSFAKYIVYDLAEIECFLYTIFVEWLEKYEFIRSFEACDIHVIYVNGGTEDEDFCAYPPCLTKYAILDSNKVNRRLLKTDGNTTMTMVTSNSDITTVLESISLDSVQQEFETQYLQEFALAISVYIDVEQQNDIKQFGTFMGLHILWYALIGLVIILCCIGCIVVYQCIQRIRRKETAKDQVEGDVRRSTTGFDAHTMIPSGALSESTRIDYGASGKEELFSLKNEKQKRKDTPSMELTVNQIHRSLKVKKKHLSPNEPDGDDTNTDNALNMIADIRKRPMIKKSMSRSESKYPDLPPDHLYNQQHAQPTDIDMHAARWNAPETKGNNAYQPVNNSNWQPQIRLSPTQDDDVGSPMSAYDNNPYNKYLQPEMADFYNSQFNQSYLKMMHAQGNGQINTINTQYATLPQDANTHNAMFMNNTEQKQKYIQAIEDDDDDDNNNIAYNPALGAVKPPPDHERKQSEAQETTGSSWKTTNDINSPQLEAKQSLYPKRNESEIEPGSGQNSPYEDDGDHTLTGFVRDDDVVMDDELHQMIMSATPIGAKGHIVLPTEDGDILEDVAQFLEFEQNDGHNEGPPEKTELKQKESNMTFLVHNNSYSMIPSVQPNIANMATMGSNLTINTVNTMDSHSKLTSITDSKDYEHEERLGMIHEQQEHMIVSDYETSVSRLYGNYNNYSKHRDNTKEFKDKLFANINESDDIMQDVVESIAGKEIDESDEDD